MRTSVVKWGTSLGVRLPRYIATALRVQEGAAVELSVDGGKLIVRPLHARRPSLKALLRSVSHRNLHGERSTGRAAGREAW